MVTIRSSQDQALPEWKAGATRCVVIPTQREVPVFIIRNNLKTAGISRREYFGLLAQMK